MPYLEQMVKASGAGAGHDSALLPIAGRGTLALARLDYYSRRHHFRRYSNIITVPIRNVWIRWIRYAMPGLKCPVGSSGWGSVNDRAGLLLRWCCTPPESVPINMLVKVKVRRWRITTMLTLSFHPRSPLRAS